MKPDVLISVRLGSEAGFAIFGLARGFMRDVGVAASPKKGARAGGTDEGVIPATGGNRSDCKWSVNGLGVHGIWGGGGTRKIRDGSWIEATVWTLEGGSRSQH